MGLQHVLQAQNKAYAKNYLLKRVNIMILMTIIEITRFGEVNLIVRVDEIFQQENITVNQIVLIYIFLKTIFNFNLFIF